MTEPTKMMVYAAGGAGINIASYFEKFRNIAEAGLAQVEPVYLDTSSSNITQSLNKNFVYTVDGLDGSGKVRAENHERISECVLEILQKFKPSDFNIVLSSASGGSGSVIAPSLVSELLKRDIPVVVITIGSTDSKIELINTVRTLKSYEAISRLRNSPVISMYYENSKETNRKEVDARARISISALAAIFCGTNRELDSSDLKNWLKYTKVTSFDAALSYLDFYDKETMPKDKGLHVISVATLATEASDTTISTPVDYQCIGYSTENNVGLLSADVSFHGAIVAGMFNNIFARLSKTLDELEEAQKARKAQSSILSNSDNPTGSGLVL